MAPTGHNRSARKEKSDVLTSDGLPLSGSITSAAVMRSVRVQSKYLVVRTSRPHNLNLPNVRTVGQRLMPTQGRCPRFLYGGAGLSGFLSTVFEAFCLRFLQRFFR